MSNRTKAFDSNLAYYVNQLDNLDRALHEPLFSVTWGRDIKLRTGITMANESTSFTRNVFGGTGDQGAQGIPFLNMNSTTIPGVSVDGERIITPLRLCGRELSYSSVELERSQLTGQPIDVQKFDGLNSLYQLSVDRAINIGDTGAGFTGLVNAASSVVDTANATTGTWGSATADQIVAYINDMCNSAWQNTGFAVCPSEIRLPPAKYAYIAGKKVSDAGNLSVLSYVAENSISLRVNGRMPNIQPLKWLTDRGAGSTQRMMAYTNEMDRVRFPMVPIRRETPYYEGIVFKAPYIYALGEVEFVYPETVIYRDGI
jgi:hypothetical protein